MSDEKASQMSVNIGKRVRLYVILFVVLILLVIWGNTLLSLVQRTISGKQKPEFVREIGASMVAVISAAALIVVNLGRDIDLHNYADRTFFGVREKTDEIIHTKMIEAARDVGAASWQNMQDKKKEVRYLFYHFINEQITLRALAFTYFEHYFSNIYVICFSIVGFIISLLIVLFRWQLDLTILLPTLFLLIFVAISLSTYYSLVKKIYDLPIQQIEEIRATKPAELKRQVEQRFS